MADRNSIFRKIVLLFDRAAARKAERETEQSVGKIDSGFGKLKKTLIGVGAALGVAAIAAVGAFARASINAAREAEVIWNRLEGTLRTVGIAFGNVEGRIKAAARAMQDTTTVGDEQFADVLQQLVIISGDFEKSLKNVAVVADLAAGAQIDLSTAAELVGKAMVGETGTLKRYGIIVKEGADAVEVMRNQFAGLAANEANTLNGKLTQLGNETGDLKEAFGGLILTMLDGSGAIDGATQLFKSLTGWVEGLTDKLNRGRDILHLFNLQMQLLIHLGARQLHAANEVRKEIARLMDLQSRGLPFRIDMPGIDRSGALGTRQPSTPDDDPEKKVKRTREQEIRGLSQARELRILTAEDIARAFALEQQINAEILAGTNLEVEKRVELQEQLKLLKEITEEVGRRRRAEELLGAPPVPGLAGPSVTPVGIPIARLSDADRKKLAEKRAQDALDANTAAMEALEIRAFDAADRMSFAFEQMGDAIVDAFQRGASAGEALAAGFVGLGRSIAASFAAGLGDYFRGRAAAAFAEFFLGNPSAIIAAGYFSAAAGIMYSLAGAASSRGGGGGRASISAGGASVPSTGGAQPQREINIYLQGSAAGLRWDVDFRDEVGAAVNIVKETHGENWNFNVNTRRSR